MTRSEAPPPNLVETLLAACERGEIDAEAVELVVYRLLDDGCSGCRDPRALTGLTRLEELPRLVARELRTLVELVAGDAGWDGAFEEIASWPRKYSSPELAAALLVKARQELPAEPERSGRWADLAAAVAGKGRSIAHRERLAQALAYRGNVVRVRQSEGYAAAEVWFAGAGALTGRGVRSDEVGTDLLHFEGAFRKDQRHSTLAVALLQQCYAATLGIAADPATTAAVVLSLAHSHLYANQHIEATRAASASLSWSRQAGSASLELAAVTHLASYAELTGDLTTARRSLSEAFRLSGSGQTMTLGRRLAWLEARIGAHAGEAEGFSSLWSLYEAWIDDAYLNDAMVLLLDLTRLAVIHRRKQDMERVVTELNLLRQRTPEHEAQAIGALVKLRAHLIGASLTPALVLQFRANLLDLAPIKRRNVSS